MFNKHFSRREFLKYSMIATGALTAQAFRPFYNPLDEQGSNNIARVTTESISVYSEPSDKSRILYQRTRDELINIYDEVISDDGPAYNPLWYRVWSGYVHSAYLQRVEIKFQPCSKKYS